MMRGLPDTVPASLHYAVAETHGLLEQRYGARLRHLVLYGSQARGDAHEESDVDLLVVLDGPFRRYDEILELVDLSMDLFNRFNEWISFTLISVSDFEDPAHPLMMNVRREGIEV
jgi:predicted nucleotidyltransferase